ncbi:SusC/RagA family TonB-linked outer membrane protein [Segetibacter sp.]|uniref:SusC/RagA family TonB-linked outer membrane protein n=1 Tax=Segetibacter sp. TaxID=2231182 RepID=UPI00262CC23D|nr:SusC/RagA family TonB-linked outer membrane protein [Segetibacter sp.]MCW3080455.1 SusC/RagA family TonB-linked outer membrane protein [Segetibacter sp.]
MNITLKRLSFCIFLFSLFLFSTSIFAQGKRITGKVTDPAGAGIQGVSVKAKNANAGGTTDETGTFALTVPQNVTSLTFSYVGFTTQEVALRDQSTINIQLTPSGSQLTDVVVVGYGTQRKREVTSAVTSVSAEEFNKGNVTNVAQLLQGKVAGLSISRPGGDPNGGFAIRLRGLSTLGANTQPLVVIDGQVGADLNSVDPNDIASIDVLKDASAAAIYGTRGSAGVLIITTKRGTSGPPKVSYNSAVTAEVPAKFTDHFSAEEYVAAGGVNFGSNTDWNKEISRTAISQTHNLSLSGGANGTTYNASVNYRDNQGVAITSGFQQVNARLNLTQRALNNKLVFNLNLTNSRRTSSQAFSEAFKYATIFNPTAPVRTKNPLNDLSGGGYFESNFVDYANPVAVLEQNKNSQTVKRLNVQGSAEYEITQGLKFLVRYSQQTFNNFRTALLPRTSFHSRNFLNVSGFARNGYAMKGTDENFNQLYENTLTYDTKFKNLSVTALAGYSYQSFLNQGTSIGAGNFITDVTADNIGTALDLKNGLANVTSYKNASRLAAFFGRLNFNYQNIAFVTLTARREGSTQFGANNKWGMFPAASAGLDLSKLFTIPTFSNLKVRASYGVTGSLPPESYLSLSTFVADPNREFYAGNGSWLAVYGPNRNANPDLKWERKAEFDIGLDFALLDNKMTGTFDYYNRNTSDLIFNVAVPVPPNLANRTWKNVGTLSSSGLEFALKYNAIQKSNFSWETGGNFSTYHVKLSALSADIAPGSYIGETNLGTPGQEATQITRAYAGEDIGLIWGPVYKGLDQTGKYLFDDGKGGTTKDENTYRTLIGKGLPKFEFGWTNTFNAGNFDLNFFIRSSIGHDLVNTYRAFYENATVVSAYNAVKTKYYDPAVKDGQKFSSLHVEKASFVKLDNATLGYNFSLSKAGPVKSLRAYVNGQNLFFITNYTGVDPEVRYSDNGNALAPGVDRRETWVRTKSFTLGVNVGF